MTRFKKQSLKDKRKKPLTKAGTAMPSMMPSMVPSMDSTTAIGPTAPEGDMSSSQGFNKGGFAHRGQGAVMKIKTTKFC